MRKSSLSKLLALTLVLAIVVSCNLAAATLVLTGNNRSGSTSASASNKSAVTNHAGQILTPQTDINWTASALCSFADSTGNFEVIVGVDNSTRSYDTVAALAGQNGGRITQTLNMGEENALVVELSTLVASEFVNQIRSTGVCSYIEPNGMYQVTSTANDPYYNLQWGLRRVGVT